MKKRLILSVLLGLALTVCMLVTAAAKPSGNDAAVKVSVYIDGALVNLSTPAVVIDSATYVPLNELSLKLGAKDLAWDGTRATAAASGLNIEASVGHCYITANGRYLYSPAVCRVIGGTLFVPVRPLGEAFGAEVTWDGQKNIVNITTGQGPIVPGSEFYENDDVLWMSRIISAEARGESFLGKIAVGNVVMNRVNSPWHPDTVYGVIFDRRSGIQFTPAYSGAIYNNPSEECVIAAKIALEGTNVVGGSLYFSSSRLGCWAARNRPFTVTIGNHSFYA